MISLYPHQQRVLDATKGMNRVAYYLDMGLGKTFVGSEKMKILGADINLLICQKSKISDWMQHFKDNSEIYPIDLTEKGRLEDFLATPIGSDPVVGVINYDLVFRRKELTRLDGTQFTLMLDESSEIQNETTKRSKFILKMHPANVILLSGTPTAGKYERLWSQLHLLGWSISKDLFYKQYVDFEWVDMDGFWRQQINGYKNVDRLKAKLAEHGAVFMKSEEAFELPEQIEIPMMVDATKDYRKFMRNSIVTVKKLNANTADRETGLEAELIGDTTLTKRLYARQLCGQYNKDKLQLFEDLIFSTNDRLIVFYNFNEELNLLQQIALKKTGNLSLVNGSRKDLQAYNLYDDSITFIQYQAGAMGLNLQKANKIVYFTLPERSELFEQSKKRIHRIGQEQSCFYYFLLCRNSVEMDVLNTLRMRKDYTDDLFENYTGSSQ